MYHAVIHESDGEAGEADETEAGDSAEQDKAPKKERVLHTRIPAVLEAELKSAARSLRVPVSNLVRTILEDAVAAADKATGRVEESLEHAAERIHSGRSRMRTAVEKRALEDVVAFQQIVVAKPTICASCGEELSRGADALLGMTETPGPRIFVCLDCRPSD